MIVQICWIAGSAIFLVLGSIHLFYTFFSEKFNPRDRQLAADMKRTFLVLTKDTTMWKAWTGFNGSHSVGAIFFGAINIILAAAHPSIIRTSPALYFLDILTVLFYLWLARKYWFRIPFAGVLLAAACFILAGIFNFFG